ncbi:MAG: TetR/AcrR family transcriptional regulator [Clostridiales bacterium]|nr:TetR/AcrR family transcriptional regulator [Clostridiales bacterium]
MEKKIDLRVKKTYMALTRSLKELLKHKNFYDITVNEICDNAMVGRGTFYKHFNDKYDFLTYVVSEIVNECMNESAETAHSDNLYEYVKVFFDKFIDAFEQNKDYFKNMDSYIVNGVVFTPITVIYNELNNHFQKFYNKNDKISSFMAQYLTIAMVIVIVGTIKGKTQNVDEAKESMYFLLEKLFA